MKSQYDKASTKKGEIFITSSWAKFSDSKYESRKHNHLNFTKNTCTPQEKNP